MKKKTSVNIDAETYTYLHGVHVPRRLYELAEIYFIKNAPTIDIGSGCGRDTSWLNHSGFPCIGIEPLIGLRTVASIEFPKYTFLKSSLPDLQGLESSKFNNVFICNVLMFVPVQDIILSVMNLLRITTTGGRIIISIGNGIAEKDGKIIESYHPDRIAQLFEHLRGKVLLIEKNTSVINLVIEKDEERFKPI